MEPWLENTFRAISALSAAGLVYVAYKSAQPLLAQAEVPAEAAIVVTSQTEHAELQTPTPEELCQQLELEHGEIIGNTSDWSSFTQREVTLAIDSGSLTQVSPIQVAVFYREADRDKVYDKLKLKGFTGNDICFFEKPMLVLSIRPCELHRIEKLPALYQRVLAEARPTDV